MANDFLVGTHIYPAKGHDHQRLRSAFDTWRNLDVPLINLAFADAPSRNEPNFEEITCLTRDSNTATGCEGIRKPLLNDLFDGLYEAAKAKNCSYFVFSNADIQLTRNFYELVSTSELDSIIFTRLDYNESPQSTDAKLFMRGQDTYAVRTQWWAKNRQHFRSYIIGESLWDNVYTSKFARLGRSSLSYSKDMCHHQRHDQKWNPGSSFGRYNEILRLRHDYLDYNMWSLYAKKLSALDQTSSNFPTAQRELWKFLSTGKPTVWLQLKRLVATPLSYAVERKLRSKPKRGG